MMRNRTTGSRFRRDRRVRTADATVTETEIAAIRDVTHDTNAAPTATVTVTATATETVDVTQTVTATEVVHETDFPRVRPSPHEKHSL
jgi:hypothetical protein